MSKTDLIREFNKIVGLPGSIKNEGRNHRDRRCYNENSFDLLCDSSYLFGSTIIACCLADHQVKDDPECAQQGCTKNRWGGFFGHDVLLERNVLKGSICNNDMGLDHFGFRNPAKYYADFQE